MFTDVADVRADFLNELLEYMNGIIDSRALTHVQVCVIFGSLLVPCHLRGKDADVAALRLTEYFSILLACPPIAIPIGLHNRAENGHFV